MSLKSWQDEFYPTPAGSFNGVAKNTTNVLAAIDHSLRKWRGLTKENLDRHGIHQHVRNLFENSKGDLDARSSRPMFTIDSNSCALCSMFLGDPYAVSFYSHAIDRCSVCPLFMVRGCSCDCASISERPARSPYARFTMDRDPRPMIDLLEKARERLVKAWSTPLVPRPGTI